MSHETTGSRHEAGKQYAGRRRRAGRQGPGSAAARAARDRRGQKGAGPLPQTVSVSEPAVQFVLGRPSLRDDVPDSASAQESGRSTYPWELAPAAVERPGPRHGVTTLAAGHPTYSAGVLGI
ncbi:hypothetical protein GCM10010495_46260 [Kitasatospora herbaricolor]|nr:hypothetical protein GCM10010495_46260 [Kitasatospora herbaricolor]